MFILKKIVLTAVLIFLLTITINSGYLPFLHGTTAKLCEAIAEGNNKEAILIAEKTSDLNRPSTIIPHLTTLVEGEVTTPLVKACETGNAEMIIWLLDHGARTDYAPVEMLYPLEAFCDSGSGAGIAALKALLDHNADPQKYKYRPPLFCLAQTLRRRTETSLQDGIDMILLLLDRGAAWQDPTDGFTVIHYAAMQRDSQFMQLLLIRADADKYLNTPNDNGLTPLELATQYENIETCRILRMAGAF